MSDLFGAAERLYDAMDRNGGKVVVRRQTKGPGTTGLINPPRVQGATLAAAARAGDTVLHVAAVSASGRLLAGDKLLVDGLTIVALDEVPCWPPTHPAGFTDVPVAPLPRDLASGLPVGFGFLADTPVPAMINSFPIRLVDGERIRSRDLQIIVPAWKLGEVVPGAWSILVNGREMAIQDATPTFEMNEVLKWSIQAR